MNEEKRTHVLGGLLNRIGNFSPDLFDKSFNSRLIFQKTIYLLQVFGLYLGYKFSWYIRGPYSPALTRKGYELMSKYEECPDVTFAKASSERKFHEFLDFLDNRKSNAIWLETIASIHFLKRVYPKKTKSEIMKLVLKKQPYLTYEECIEAWAHLERFNLINQK